MMSSDNIPLVYVDCDIADGVTLTEWRREKVAAARQARVEAREARSASRSAALKRLRPRLAPRSGGFRPRFV